MSFTVYSSHIFMFPFRFDWNEDGFGNDKIHTEYEFYKKISIEKRVDIKLSTLEERLEEWEYRAFDLQKQSDLYNEYAYFYDYARDAIYNQNTDTDAISYYFERKNLNKDATYEIKILKRDEPYILNITGISLRIFATGVAILSIELENRNYEDLQDILNINDFGRRIYPQYIDSKTLNPSIQTKNSFLADYIKIVGISSKQIEETFQFVPCKDIKIGLHIMELLGDGFSQRKKEKRKYYIQPILDDRMFVISWYGKDSLSQILKTSYCSSDDWYRYVFVDNGDVTVKNQRMKKELLKTSTYDRWSDQGTLYGISRYSFVCLTNREWFATNIIYNHMQTMYFQMATLLLATRASILRFSDEIAAVANEKKVDRLESLYERYLTFYNRLYFKEVTHQDQGIELYDMARKQMRIDEHIEKLDNKFTKLFEFADLRAEKENSRSLDLLTEMGAIFIPPSLLIALYSMGIFDYMKSKESLFIGLIVPNTLVKTMHFSARL